MKSAIDECFPDREQVKQAIITILRYVGEDPTRQGLIETPDRIIKSYEELFGGYGKDPSSVCKVFNDGATDELVILKNIPFFSTCEHHGLPFHGLAHIGYLPAGDRIIGASKLARILEIYSRRFQVQERLTQQVTEALDTHLKPLGSGCVIEAVHLCIACRGVRLQGCEMVTSSLTGLLRSSPEVRSEFLRLIGKL